MSSAHVRRGWLASEAAQWDGPRRCAWWRLPWWSCHANDLAVEESAIWMAGKGVEMRNRPLSGRRAVRVSMTHVRSPASIGGPAGVLGP